MKDGAILDYPASQGESPALAETAPPHSIEAEQAFMGALLWDNGLFDAVSDWLAPEHFYDPVHGRIYRIAAEMIGSGRLCDGVMLKARLEADGGLKEIGGTAYLAELVAESVDAASGEAYARLIYELSRRRALIELSADMAREARTGEGEDAAERIIETAESRLSALCGASEEGREAGAAEAFDLALAEIDNPSVRIPTRLHALEERMGGWRPGGVYIIAGRSSMGKTALGVEAAWRVAESGLATVFVSIEMPRQEVACRIGASLTGIQYRKILSGQVDMEDRRALRGARERIAAAPLTIMDVPGVTVAGLRARLRRWKRAQLAAGRKIGVAVVDYLQLIKPERDAGSIYADVTKISRALKPLARSLQIPLIVLAQLSRETEREKDKRPRLSHLRDSGAIEEDADAVLLLYRDAYYADREPEHDDTVKEQDRKNRAGSYEIEIDVAKNRQGAIGRVSLWCDVKTNQFREWR
ncbi:replicative DNA helicase [Marinicauda algicola]|uniref:DNA 5'-3' helicase n=1 Tax=Marinicauda algicola TaxID=2029849 RepID=A0A4S2GWW6_9PROT|nr:replicative DNA helicase [Marinicauda algicola]TGY87341.1 replicative DNA helicase [Marinicauda algicola]